MIFPQFLANRAATAHARRQYRLAISRHFDEAHRLVRQGDPDGAERMAKGAAILRWFADTELGLR